MENKSPEPQFNGNENNMNELDYMFLKEINYDYFEYDINDVFPFFKKDEEDIKRADVIFPEMRLTEDQKDDTLKYNNGNYCLNNDQNGEYDYNNLNNNSINMISSNNSHSFNKGEEIIEKISSYISNYQEIIKNQTESKSPNHFDLDSNIKLAENTLVGSIISLMKRNGRPLTKDYIYDNIKDKFLSFRKANGAKYSADTYIALKSTLNTSGIFYKTNEDTYFYKEKESMDFVIKTVERELNKKISKDKKNAEKKSSLSSKKHKKKNNVKNKINELSINHQLGYKICKLNIILDNMLEKCQEKNSYQILNKKLDNEGIEMIKKISENDKFLGMILCIKFFKNIIENYIKFSNKKKNIEKYFDVNKFNKKIINICEKIEKLEESFNYHHNLKSINIISTPINSISQDIFNKMDDDD